MLTVLTIYWDREKMEIKKLFCKLLLKIQELGGTPRLKL